MDSVDLKGLYEGSIVDQGADPVLYRRVAEAFPDAWIEDPKLTAETDLILRPHRDRITWDANIHGIADIEGLPFTPRMVNVKPSRLGPLRSLFATYEYCEARGIGMYGGGQFELGVGRGQIQYLASIFHPDTPNDVAPARLQRHRGARRAPRQPAAGPGPRDGLSLGLTAPCARPHRFTNPEPFPDRTLAGPWEFAEKPPVTLVTPDHRRHTMRTTLTIAAATAALAGAVTAGAGAAARPIARQGRGSCATPKAASPPSTVRRAPSRSATRSADGSRSRSPAPRSSSASRFASLRTGKIVDVRAKRVAGVWAATKVEPGAGVGDNHDAGDDHGGARHGGGNDDGAGHH